jgi:transposase
MARFDLTDFEWSVIQPLLPNKPRGVAWVDDRRVLNGIFWRLRTGAPWADIPERYGLHTTCVNRLNPWRKAGIWDRLLEEVSKAYDGDIQMIDSSSIRVHQHAANIKKRRAILLHGSLARRLDDENPCAGRCRGFAHRTEADRRPAHDGRSARDMLDALIEGQVLMADRAYDSDEIRQSLAERGAWANIKPMPNRKNVPAFSAFLYRYRNLVERFFNKIKHYRAVATRFDKRAENFLAGVKLASLRIWIRFNESIA